MYVRALPPIPFGARLRRRSGVAHLAGRVLTRLERITFARSVPRPDRSRSEIRRHNGRLRVVDIIAGVTPRDAARANRDLVVGLCERHGVPYFALPQPGERQATLGIAGEHWPALTAALLAAGHQETIYVGVAAGTVRRQRRWAERSTDERIARAVTEQRELEVFRIVAAGADQPLYDRPWACVVQLWQREKDGTLTAPTRNARASSVASGAQRPVAIPRWGRRIETLQAFTPRNIFDVDFPIDAVYMWVDGSDPRWRARQDAALGRPVGTSELEDHERYRDNGELRYSLRSLELYAPWLRQIYLVTDRQVPDWLADEHPRLTLVDHTDIFGDSGTLPSFNSHAIGARLHHISGLSEHYLHFNDDFFLGREVSPQTFFQSNGVSKFFLSRSSMGIVDGTTVHKHEDARRNVIGLLAREFGRSPTRTFFHTPIPQRRSIMFALEQRFPAELAATWSHQVRDSGDYEVNSWLHHYYGYLTGAAAPASISYDYFELTSEAAWRRMTMLSRHHTADVFCINDTAATSVEQRQRASDWLEAYFPCASSFEKR